MKIEHNDAWGQTHHKQSSGIFNMLVINSLFAVFFFVASVMHSFLQLPMFGDEMESSPKAIIISTLILTITFDAIALWRAFKLSNLWTTSVWNKFFLWVYQSVFITVVFYSNFWMMSVVWFWWDKY